MPQYISHTESESSENSIRGWSLQRNFRMIKKNHFAVAGGTATGNKTKDERLPVSPGTILQATTGRDLPQHLRVSKVAVFGQKG